MDNKTCSDTQAHDLEVKIEENTSPIRDDIVALHHQVFDLQGTMSNFQETMDKISTMFDKFVINKSPKTSFDHD